MLAGASEQVFVEQVFGFVTGQGFGALQKVNGQQPQNVQQYKETVGRLPTQPRREPAMAKKKKQTTKKGTATKPLPDFLREMADRLAKEMQKDLGK